MRRSRNHQQFDALVVLGREIISRSRDDHELQQVELWAELLSVEVRLERLSRANTTVTPDPDGEPLLSTAKEAAKFLGPSFSARKLYRLTAVLPPGAVVRKGGRLYYVLRLLREWASKR